MNKLQSYNWVYKKYWEEHLTLKEISILLSCSPQTVLNNMKCLGIPRRDAGEKSKVPPQPEKEWLYDKYWREQLTAAEIGKLLECSNTIVLKWMRELSIPCRSPSEKLRVAWRKGKLDSREHSTEGRKGIAAATKKRWANGSYSHINFSANFSGEKNPNWRGGISAEGYPHTFSSEFKEIIRRRDEYKCAICGAAGKQVHHIDYNKENTNLENCVTLCRSCHCATNYNRQYWQEKLSGR